jgi:hypothetical protein
MRGMHQVEQPRTGKEKGHESEEGLQLRDLLGILHEYCGMEIPRADMGNQVGDKEIPVFRFPSGALEMWNGMD